METKKFRSIIRQVVLLPLLVLLVIMSFMMISTIISYLNVEKQMIESNVNAMQISLNQLENQLTEMDHDFIQYITSNKSYTYLSNMDKDTPTNEYFLYQADTIEWLSNQLLSFKDVDGVFAYYSNMDLLIFRGNNPKKKASNDYITFQLKNVNITYNHWQIIDIKDRKYLIIFKKYLKFIWGCWIPLESLTNDYGLVEDNLLGTVYVVDGYNNNTLKEEKLNQFIKNNGVKVKKVSINQSTYRNYYVATKKQDVNFGMLIPKLSIFHNIPIFNKLIFITAFLSLLLIPSILYWLQTRIARPLKDVDAAMTFIGEGDLEYRLPLSEKKYLDEFDRLIMKFNEMMDDINDLEYNLYKTKINEQRTELKYISQQIRPHFILNALNIIYTYEEKEFPLVKKMVLYLSEYFQYIVNLKVDFVEVEKEFRHIDNYLRIQKERYPEGFEYLVKTGPDVSECLIPPLLIQTFAENCIKYAMKNNELLFIEILAEELEGKLKIKIEDTGNGFSEKALIRINKFIEYREYQEKLGVGIQNAIERLDILYQKDYLITIANTPAGGAIVELLLPLEPIS